MISVAAFLGYSLLLGGIPYVVFMGSALWLLRRKSAATYFRFSATAPLTFAVLLTVFLETWFWIEGDGSMQLQNRLDFLSSLSLFLITVATGYLYVLPLELLRVVLRRAGVVRESDQRSAHPAPGVATS